MTTVFQRKTPDGKFETLDAFGKPVETSTKAAEPALKSGELPGNTTGIGKLKAMQPSVTTYEGLRAATDDQLTAAGLDAEQIGKLREVQAQTVKAD